MLMTRTRRAIVALTLGVLSSVASNASAQSVPTDRAGLPRVTDYEVVGLCAQIRQEVPSRSIPDVHWAMSKCAQAVLVSLEQHSSNPAQIIALTFLWKNFYEESLVVAFPGLHRRSFAKFEEELKKDPTTGYPVLDELIKYAVGAAIECVVMVTGAVQKGVLGIFDTTPLESAYSRYQWLDASVSRLSVSLLKPHLENVAAGGTNVWKKWDAMALRAYPANTIGPPSNLRILP